MPKGVYPRSPRTLSVEERFWLKVDKDGPLNPILGSPCWLWTGGTVRSYGRFYISMRRPVLAHRYAYELTNGEVRPELQMDHHHLCPKVCVNPGHLRPVTNKQNQENATGARSNSKSGVRGVWRDRGGRWCGQVTHHGHVYWAGRYVSREDAEAAVIAKRNELFTHNDLDRVG